MSGTLTLQETASSQVRQAIESGEWKLVKDTTGRECYFNENTKETTRDLRLFLLRRLDFTNVVTNTRPDVKPVETALGGPSSQAEVRCKELETNLELAKRTIALYERELCELRNAHFGVPKRTAEAMYRPPAEKPSEEQLRMQLAASRELNQILLDRVATDRLQKGLCSNCLSQAVLPAVAVEHASLMANPDVEFPKSLRQFSAHNTDRILIRAVAGPSSVGYVPTAALPLLAQHQYQAPTPQSGAAGGDYNYPNPLHHPQMQIVRDPSASTSRLSGDPATPVDTGKFWNAAAIDQTPVRIPRSLYSGGLYGRAVAQQIDLL